MPGDSAKGEHGQKYYYYTCMNKRRRKCAKKREPKEALEDFIVSKLIEILHSDQNYLEEISQRVADNLKSGSSNTEKADLEKRLANNQKKIQSLVTAVEEGMPYKSVSARLSELEAENERISMQIEEITLSQPPEITAEQILFMLERLADGMAEDPEYRRRIVDIFLNSVYLYDDGKVIKLTNHSGGTLGGISDGSDIILRAALKPTPSIAREQNTVNRQHENVSVSIRGRHDPIVVRRAMVVVEAMAALTILDLLLANMHATVDGIRDFYSRR